jgi:hypothetical protein
MSSDIARQPRGARETFLATTSLTTSFSTAIWLAAALLGAALVAYCTAPWGPAVNEVGLHNFAAAEGLRSGTPMTLSRGEPYVMWPPLMPLLLAAGRSLGFSYSTVGLALNLAAHATTLFLGAFLLMRLFGSIAAAAGTQLMLLVSPELLRSASTLQTESVFIALVLAGLVASALYLEHPSTPRLAAVTLAVMLACLQRYLGVALALGVFLVLLRFPSSLPRAKRILRACAFGALSVGPIVLWMLRNRIVGKSWVQIEDPSRLGVLENARATIGTLAQYITLDPLRAGPSLALAVAAIALLAFVVARARAAPSERERWCSRLYLSFPLLYPIVLVAATSWVNLDPIGNRYVIPMYPFVWGLLLLGFVEMRARLDTAPRSLKIVATTAVAALLLVHVVLAIDRTRAFVEHAREDGPGGFATRVWQRSSLVEWLRANPIEGQIYTNLPEVVLFAAGRRATFVEPDSLQHDLEPAEVGAHVVWVERLPRRVPFPELPPGARRLACVAQLDVGSVYVVED